MPERRRALLAWHERFSRFSASSELSRLNRDPAATVAVRPLMRRVIEAALTAARDTGGLVDVTLAVAVSVSIALGTTAKVTVAEAPTASVPRLATTLDPWRLTVPEGVAVPEPVTSLAPPSSGTVTVTPVAADGPLLTTTMV